MEETERYQTRYIPVPLWSKYHPWPTLGGMRDLVFKRKENGFDVVVKKIGKRILIDEKAFFEWMKDK